MFNFWDWIVDFVSTIGLILEQSILSLLNAFHLINSIVLLPFSFIGFVPGILYSSLILFISISVLKFLLGR